MNSGLLYFNRLGQYGSGEMRLIAGNDFYKFPEALSQLQMRLGQENLVFLKSRDLVLDKERWKSVNTIKTLLTLGNKSKGELEIIHDGGRDGNISHDIECKGVSSEKVTD